MRHWLFKTEPDAWSWDDQRGRGAAGEPWTGVRNHQARNNMRAMAVGDRGFFYHSGRGPEIVGTVEVIAPAAPDPTADDPRWQCVTLRALASLPRPVTLAAVRADPRLARMVLVTNSRLSVQPVTAEEWGAVCALGGLDPDLA